MPRPLTGELGLAAASEKSEFVHLLDFEFSTGNIFMTTGTQDLVTQPYATRIGNVVTRYYIRNPVNAPWPTSALSIEWWGRLDADADTQDYCVAVSYGQGAQPNTFFAGVDVVSGLIRMALQINGTQVTDPAASPDDAAWHHYVMTWLDTGAFTMYRDGVLRHSGTGLQAAYSIPGSGAVVLGQEQDTVGGSFQTTQAWKGELDNVRIYRRVLTATEVAEHFIHRFVNEQKLVALWKFDKLPLMALQNPGFESGDTGWALVPGATIVSDGNARSGSWALKYATDGVGGPNVLNNHRLKVKPGDYVFVEAWMKTAAGTGTTTLAVRFRDANDVQVGLRTQVDAGVTGPQASYVVQRGIVVVPLGAEYVVFDVGENNADNTTTPWYIDDCVMTQSPGVDSGPLGNHLQPVGILDAITDTPLRKTWSAVGGLLKFGGVEEAGDPRGQGVDVQISAVTQTALAALLGGTTYRGRKARIWRAHLDQATGTVVDDPLLLIEGLQLAPYEIQEDRDSRAGGTVNIRTRIRGRMGIERLRGIWSNLTSHQQVFTGDTFFRHVVQLANSRVHWGVAYPRVGGGGGGFSDSGGRNERGDQPQDAM